MSLTSQSLKVSSRLTSTYNDCSARSEVEHEDLSTLRPIDRLIREKEIRAAAEQRVSAHLKALLFDPQTNVRYIVVYYSTRISRWRDLVICLKLRPVSAFIRLFVRAHS